MSYRIRRSWIVYPVLLLLVINTRLSAQCFTNILTNPGFETPVVPIINGNNIQTSTLGDWVTENGSDFNIIRVNGSSYASGADNAAEGSQYVDIAGANDYPTQSFTLTTNSTVYFSGKISNRESTFPGFASWTARIDILSASNALIASSNAKSMTADLGDETWFMLAGEVTLPAGTYKYRAFVDDFGHFDDAFLCVTPTADDCTNRLEFSGDFETPPLTANNMDSIVGSSFEGWSTQNGSDLRLSRVNGTSFSSGPDVAYRGNQYLSIAGTGDYMLKTFSLSCVTDISFAARFSSRPNGSYIDWTAQIDILNSANTIVGSSTSQSFTSSSPQEIWYTLPGTATGLPPGNYKMRVSLGREGNFDAGFLCIESAGCFVLPVQWQQFTAKKINNSVQLEWITSSEQNTKDFTVQHRTSDRYWNDLVTIPASGTSNSSLSYSYTHTNPGPSVNYYRIMQTDIDDKRSYSGIRTVDLAAKAPSFTLLRNYTENGMLQVTVNDTPCVLNLYSIDGKLIWSKRVNTGNSYLSLNGYTKGLYLLKSADKTERIVIQ